MSRIAILFLVCPFIFENLVAGTFDGANHHVKKPCITSGSNVLTIDFVYIWDNGEGKDPWGNGSDWGYAGPIPWKHGPMGNIHIMIYSTDGILLRHVGNLPGPHWTGSKYEWDDNEWMAFRNFGIYDWDQFSYDTVEVVLYESDAGPGRSHDDLIRVLIDRFESGSIPYSSTHVAELWLKNRKLPQKSDPVVTRPSTAFILNATDWLNASFEYFDGNRWYSETLGPNEYTPIYVHHDSTGIFRVSCWPTTCDYEIIPGNKYSYDGKKFYKVE